ncbi:hypothetical protein A9Q75_19610 [Colwellia psychrerythraea]|uniref:Probable membrane transporter protein n=1 Tax=Colwellia psychrerythraea TaxID=28229 RepID=A0A1Y5E1R2_COLPS|nr:hypothetical protein A9Q75_19610 [Colwellia psychrerythraea]
MILETILSFMAILAVATYVQTVTGFALGMIVMGAVTVSGLVPIAFTSVIISTVTLFNCLFVLKGEFRTFDYSLAAKTCIGIFPGLFIGLILLDYMSSSFGELLQLLLGLTIIIAGLLIILKPKPLKKKSQGWAFGLSGVASGLLAGLFSMGGPPLVYLFYRQPLELKTIRLCLLSVFLVSSVSRITMVGFQGGLSWNMLYFSLLCMPVVMTFSWVGKHFPPPLSATNMRRVAFTLLIVIGLSLIIA